MLFPRALNRAFITELTECYYKLRFTPHCIRHICATDTIKTTFFIQHMDGFQAAAKMLFDAERTIEQTYADFGPKNYQTWRHAGIERQKALLEDSPPTSQQPAPTKSKGSFMKSDRAFISANPGLEDFDEDELSEYLNSCALDKASIRRVALLVKKNRKKRRSDVA